MVGIIQNKAPKRKKTIDLDMQTILAEIPDIE